MLSNKSYISILFLICKLLSHEFEQPEAVTTPDRRSAGFVTISGAPRKNKRETA